MAALFSLILPAYNVAPYLERCLRSILDQSMTDYEVILVDDGSGDDTPSLCDAFAAKYDGIRVIHKENGGLSSARNAGLAQAEGEYVWFIDSDDWIEPDALAILRQACETDADMVKFGYIRAEGEGRKAYPGFMPAGEYCGEAIGTLLQAAFAQAGKYQLSAWSHVYRRAFLLENGMRFVSERIICSEDYLFSLQALVQAKTVLVLKQLLYVYDLRQGSLTQSYKHDLAQRYTELHRQLRDSFAQADRLMQYGPLIDRFYVWHLIIGTAMAHEYRRIGAGSTAAEAGRNVRAMLEIPALRQAAKRADCEGLPMSRRLLLWAIPLRAERIFRYRFTRKLTYLLK
ncbi:MAG: glycosyltransferase family 2 protein [Clostridiales bacterium]|nr:glycosyltransferase family 2 protein [Clostridiales bacterium]